MDARPKDSAATDMSGIVYHRLDLMPQDDSCIYMKHLTSMGSTGLYLSGNALQQRYIGPLKDKNEERWLAQGYFAYLTDMTRLIANPGFKDQIRNEVSLLIKGTPGWQKLAQNSKFSRYIVRRYAATADGVLLMYPASLIVGDYDPTSRGWFVGALQERDAYFHVSPPYLDPGQAGYLVTLSTVVRSERYNQTLMQVYFGGILPLYDGFLSSLRLKICSSLN